MGGVGPGVALVIVSSLCRTIGSRRPRVPTPRRTDPSGGLPPCPDLPVRLHRVRPRLRAGAELHRRRADRPAPSAAAGCARSSTPWAWCSRAPASTGPTAARAPRPARRARRAPAARPSSSDVVERLHRLGRARVRATPAASPRPRRRAAPPTDDAADPGPVESGRCDRSILPSVAACPSAPTSPVPAAASDGRCCAAGGCIAAALLARRRGRGAPGRRRARCHRRVGVLAAGRDLPAGTLLEVDDLTRVALPPDGVPDGADHRSRRRGRPHPGRPAAAGRAGHRRPPGRLRRSRAPTPTSRRLPVRLPDAGAVRLLAVGDRIDLLATDPQSGTTDTVAAGATVLALPLPADATGVGGAEPPGALVVVGVDAGRGQRRVRGGRPAVPRLRLRALA